MSNFHKLSKFQTDTRLSRIKQINTLQVFNENVHELAVGSDYRIDFRSGDLSLALHIRLGKNFPAERPEVHVEPPVLHPWVDPFGKVDSPGLRSFSPHSDLGMVVLAIRRELEKARVSLRHAPSQQKPGVVVAAAAAQSNTAAGPDVAVLTALRSRLSFLSEEELKELLNDEDEDGESGGLDALLADLRTDSPALAELEGEIASQRENLRRQAEENLELQTQIDTARGVIISQYEDFHSKKAELGATYQRLRELEARAEPKLLADNLVHLSLQSEEESEDIAERFLAKDIQVEEYLASYIRVRAQGHVRKLKADRLRQMK